MKKYITILLIFVTMIFINGCTNFLQKIPLKTVEKRVIQTYEAAYSGEKFYFLSGPVYDPEKGRTNIRYRGLISTKKLEDMGYYKGISIEMENPNSDVWVRDYVETLEYLKYYLPLKEEAKKIFGDNLIFEINGTYTDGVRDIVLNNLGKNLPVDKKTGFSSVVFTMFVNDLDKDVMEKQIEWKEKMLAIGKKYWEYYNLLGSFQLYIFDRKLLYSHDLAWANIGEIKNTDTKLKGYLERIRAGERLSQEEEAYVLGRMGSGYAFISVSYDFYKYKNLISVKFGTDTIRKEEELILKNISISNNEWAWSKK